MLLYDYLSPVYTLGFEYSQLKEQRVQEVDSFSFDVMKHAAPGHENFTFFHLYYCWLYHPTRRYIITAS